MIEIFFPTDWFLLMATSPENEHGALYLGDGMMFMEERPSRLPESSIVKDVGLVWKIPKLYTVSK